MEDLKTPKKKCSVKGCEEDVRSLGKCEKHYKKEYYQLNRVAILDKLKERYVYDPIKTRAKHILEKYNLNPEQHKALWEFQKCKCAICGEPIELTGNGTHIDHCHTGNSVRGMLCRLCNHALAWHDKYPGLCLKMDNYRENAPGYSKKYFAIWAYLAAPKQLERIHTTVEELAELNIFPRFLCETASPAP